MKSSRKKQGKNRSAANAPWSSSSLRLFLKVEVWAAALIAPLASLLLFVVVFQRGWLSEYFPWGHGVVLLLLLAWFLRALAQIQERFAVLHLDIQSLAEKDLPEAEREVVVVARRFLRPSLWQWTQVLRKRSRGAVACLAALFVLGAVWGGWSLGDGGQGLWEDLTQPSAQMTVWVTPPAYTGEAPQIIATPADIGERAGVLRIAAGSVLSVSVPGGGDAPVLQINNSSRFLSVDEHGDYAIAETIEKGSAVAISRGWRSLGFWRLELIQDKPPRIAFKSAPVVTDKKTVGLFFSASDDQKISKIALLIKPAGTAPALLRADNEMDLAVPTVAQVDEAVYSDLTSNGLAGLPVLLQLRVIDSAGHASYSEKMPITLPERMFMNPLAQALIEERRQILADDNPRQREEAAGIMAGVARQKAFYHDDPVVLMALRSGAMRLVLNDDVTTIEGVAALMWRSAVRIEDGVLGLKREAVRAAEADLSAAIDARVGKAMLSRAVGAVGRAVTLYLEALADGDDKTHKNGPVTLSVTGASGDVQGAVALRLIDLQSAAAQEDWDGLRATLGEVQSVTENIHPTPASLSAEQKKAWQQFARLKKIAENQKKLQYDTDRAASWSRNSNAEKRLAARQKTLAHQLRAIVEEIGQRQPRLSVSLSAMEIAAELLEKSGAKAALDKQDEALKNLRLGMMALLQAMPESKPPASKALFGKSDEGKTGHP